MTTTYEPRPIELKHHDRGHASLGGKHFNRSVDPKIEKKYQQLREQGWDEVAEREKLQQRAHEAYERGDGATAKQLSNEAKRHAASADQFFDEASLIAFEKNNPDPPENTDYIDLHGQYVHEAEKLVKKRIEVDQGLGKRYLHVIVGKGNHSVDHVQKLKPAVEKVCRDFGLQYETEENEGRIFVNLEGGNVSHMPPPPPQNYYDDQQQYYPSQHGQHGQQHGGQNQQEEQYEDIERLVTKLFKKFCCTVM
ncbi:DUF1771-domain-containing protein [Xylaria arbuscula]|nr:DUF1771-domain-containing protein [Xylaria arbuscula]